MSQTPEPAPTDGEQWIPLADSTAVTNNAVTEATVGDSEDEQDLVLWRDTNGTPCVMEARCPHMHSHLGAEGTIDGDEIICCTHWWRFDTSGTGTYVGADGERHERSAIVVFPCEDRDGTVWVKLPGQANAS